MIKTVNLAAGAELAVDKLGGTNTRIVNRTSAMLYASRTDGIIKGGSNVLAVPSGKGDYLEGTCGRVYLLSEAGGEVQLEGADTFRPFDSAAVTGGKAVGNPVVMDGLQGGVPFSEITVSGEDISGKELTLNVCGKNMLKNPYSGKSVTSKGVTFTGNSDGGIIISGTNDGTYFSEIDFFSFTDNFIFPVGKYTLSVSELSDETARFIIDCYDSNNVWVKTFANKNNQTFEITQNDIDAGYKIRAYIRVYKNITADRTYYPQVEFGTAATAYEPYSGAEYKLTPDSNLYTVPADIRQLEGRNTLYTADSGARLSVRYSKANAELKRIWDKLDELTTAIVVSSGE